MDNDATYLLVPVQRRRYMHREAQVCFCRAYRTLSSMKDITGKQNPKFEERFE
jgi:hypothetical protein